MSRKHKRNNLKDLAIEENDNDLGGTIFIIGSVLIVVLVLGSLFVMYNKDSKAKENPVAETTQNISNEPDNSVKQTLNLTAKGGYSPKTQTAKADVPTILKVATKNTFDCSSSISIRSLGIRKSLPGTGVTEIEIPAQKAGTTLRGTCSMGMYSFDITFS